MATRSGAHTLEAILTNSNGRGDGTEYIRGTLAGELISRSRGNNFVCIVNSEEEFYKDQSDFSNCQGITDHEKPEGRGGGYVYCPVNGKLRLNFYVNGDDLRSEGQLHIHVLYPEWAGWIKEQSSASKQELETDWPVRW